MISEACATPNSAEGNRRPIRTSESTAHRAPANFTSTRAAFEPVIPSQQVQRLASVHSTKRTTICLNATERLRHGRESRWAASDPLLHSCANHYCVRALEACACDSISKPRAPEHWTVGATQPSSGLESLPLLKNKRGGIRTSGTTQLRVRAPASCHAAAARSLVYRRAPRRWACFAMSSLMLGAQKSARNRSRP